MRIKIDDIELDVWESGFPIWFHIESGDSRISFAYEKAQAICSALQSLIDNIKLKERRKLNGK